MRYLVYQDITQFRDAVDRLNQRLGLLPPETYADPRTNAKGEALLVLTNEIAKKYRWLLGKPKRCHWWFPRDFR